jgi:NADH dehydrogenase/NADH:ubiquinone oxidoreductase subunit G
VEITSRAGERLGLSFVGRGFNVDVDVPFEGTLNEALRATAGACVRACPTGALAWKDES